MNKILDVSVDPSRPQKGTLTYNGETYPCALGRSSAVPEDKKVEGDGATPLGTYRLKSVFYRKDKLTYPLKTHLPSQALTQKDGWCDDLNDLKNYNQHVTLPYTGSHEKLWHDKDDLYDIIIVIDHNLKPAIAGKGSAIFIHVARPNLTPTEGCIALEKKILCKILETCPPNAKIKIAYPPSKACSKN